MFRGITRNEHLVAIATIVLIFGGVLYHQFKVEAERRIEITGAVQNFTPTEWRRLATQEPEEGGTLDRAVVEGRIDLNLAGPEVLQALPGIGPSRAETIVLNRKERGPFRSIEDLGRVSGIGEKTLEALRPLVFVSVPPEQPNPPETPRPGLAAWVSPPPPEVTPIRTQAILMASPLPLVHVNRATAEELETLDGIGEKRARDILVDRLRHGPYSRPEDLMRVSGIGEKTIEKNRYRLVFD